MKRPRVKLDLYKKTGTEVSGIPINIDNWSAVTITNSYMMKEDTFNIRVPVHIGRDAENNITYSITKYYGTENNTDSTPIKAEDRISLWAWNEGDAGSTLLMDGRVTHSNFSKDGKGRLLEIKGNNNTEMMLNTMAAPTYPTGSTLTTPEMIFSIISRVNRFNRVRPYNPQINRATSEATAGSLNLDRKLYADYTGSFSGSGFIDGNGFIQAEKWGGGIFASTNPYVSPYRNAFQLIQVISTPKYTGDDVSGNFILWVDEDRRIHWKSRPPYDTTTGSTIDEDDYDIKLNKDSKNIVNAMRISCGKDVRGAGIAYSIYDAKSGGKNGWKWKYEPDISQSAEIMRLELQLGSANNSGSILDIDNFPQTYPWTMDFNEVDAFKPYLDAGSTKQVVNSDTEYNNAIRNRSKRVSYDKYVDILARIASAKYVANVTPRNGEAVWYSYLGHVYQFNIKSYSDRYVALLPLRLKQITSSFDKSRWTQQIKFEEDENTYKIPDQ